MTQSKIFKRDDGKLDAIIQEALVMELNSSQNSTKDHEVQGRHIIVDTSPRVGVGATVLRQSVGQDENRHHCSKTLGK